MAAPKGNEYYLLRSKDGRETEYQPAELLEVANGYFKWCLDNPLLEETIQKRKINRDEEIIEKVTLNKMRPFTLQGFCNYAEICINTFKAYEDREEFMTVATRIRGIIEGHQFEGAAAGFLNANIIARKLGLVDRNEHEIKSEPRIFKLND